MLNIVDDLVCQLFHGKWAEIVSYSRQGRWKCTKPGCAAQARDDRASASSGCPVPVHTTPLNMRPGQRLRHRRARSDHAA
jgi:hypothetical protein